MLCRLRVVVASQVRALAGAQVRTVKNVLDRIEAFHQLTGRRHRGTDQPRALHRHSRPLRDRAIVDLVFGTGLRRAEVVGLDLDQLTPATPTEFRRAKKAKLTGVRGKGRTSRTVFLGRDTRHAIADYLEHERPGDDDHSQALFLSAATISSRRPGGRMSPRSVNTIFDKIGRLHDAEIRGGSLECRGDLAADTDDRVDVGQLRGYRKPQAEASQTGAVDLTRPHGRASSSMHHGVPHPQEPITPPGRASVGLCPLQVVAELRQHMMIAALVAHQAGPSRAHVGFDQIGGKASDTDDTATQAIQRCTPGSQELPKVQVLRQVWVQQYWTDADGQLTLRKPKSTRDRQARRNTGPPRGSSGWTISPSNRGQIYGTIILDCETGAPLELLEGREAGPLPDWLAAHPGVEVFCRDRSGSYAEAVRVGAPEGG